MIEETPAPGDTVEWISAVTGRRVVGVVVPSNGHAEDNGLLKVRVEDTGLNVVVRTVRVAITRKGNRI